MQLALETRVVGRVTIVRCNGRIIGGKESDSLRAHVAWLLRDRRDIILHMGDVGFIDSSGLGMMVRALANTRQARGDLKLCNVPENVRKVLDITHLATVFDAHESEENAIAAFYRPGASAETPVAAGHRVLCLDSDINVLAYLRELLRGAGYDVQSSSRLSDAMLLMRVERYHLLLVGPDMTATEARPQAFREACARMTVIELGSEFSASDAGEAGAGLLQLIEVRLNAKSA